MTKALDYKFEEQIILIYKIKGLKKQGKVQKGQTFGTLIL